MFNNTEKLEKEITELKYRSSNLVKQLNTKEMYIDKLNKQIDDLVKEMYSSHLNCSVVIDWANINAVSVRRISNNTTKITYKKLDGEYSYIDVQCNVDIHETLCDEFAEYIAI
jgi:predicted RNase H-like nuclease (RuvC/YqgF family)